jgi:hypothetical protein
MQNSALSGSFVPQALHTLGALACIFAPQFEQKAAPSDSLFPQL